MIILEQMLKEIETESVDRGLNWLRIGPGGGLL
jgi:hypothetical protein